MDDEEDDFGFVADDFGFEEGAPLPGSGEVAPGYRETGERNRVTDLGETTIVAGGPTITPTGPARVYEERTIEKAPRELSTQPGDVVGPGLPGRGPGVDPSRTEAPGDPMGQLAGAAERFTEIGGTQLDPAIVLRRLLQQRERTAADPSRVQGSVLDQLAAAAGTAPTADGEPIVGRDLRSRAPLAGALDTLTLGNTDELAGFAGHVDRPWLGRGGHRPIPLAEDGDASPWRVYHQARDEARATGRAIEEQDPSGYGLGAIAGAAPMLAVPGSQATWPARIAAATGVGALSGTVRGLGESDETEAPGLLRDMGRQGAFEGALSGLTAGTFEAGAGILGRLGPLARGALPGARQQATQAGLQSRGIWGRRAMEAARERPGGQEALLQQLDEAGAPLDARRMPAWIDERLQAAGPRVGEVAQQIDDAGARVDVNAMMDRLRAMAEREAQAPIGGTQRAQALRRFADDLAPFADDGMTFSQAHQQRRMIDDMIHRFSPDPNLSLLAGQRQTVRRVVSDSMDDAAGAVGMRDAWREANSDYALGMELDDIARGAERGNGQGGMGGAVSRARGIGRMMTGDFVGGAQELGIAPMIQQESRMRAPGLQYRAWQRILPYLERVGENPALAQAARQLAEAQSRGEVALAAMHARLTRESPEYRRAMRETEEE